MRKLNVKFLFAMLLVLLVLAGVLFGVHRLQAANIAGGLRWQADQAEQDGRLKVSVKYLSRYLEFAPHDLDQRARMAKMLSSPKLAVTPRARDRARFVIDQVLIQDPDRADLRKCLVRLSLDERNLEAAEEQLKILQKQAPKDGEVAALWAQVQEKKGKDLHALDKLYDAVKYAPELPDGYVHLIKLLRKLDRGQQGKHFQETVKYAELALSRGPNDVAVLLAVAEVAQDQGHWDKARAHLDKALKLEGHEGRVFQALAQWEIRQGRRDQAIDRLRKALVIVPEQDRFELSWTLSNLLLDANEVEEAIKFIPQPKIAGTPDPASDFLRARVQLAQRHWYEASAQLERVRSAFKASPALVGQIDLYLGKCYEQLQEPARQLAAYNRVLEVDENNAAARQGAATALMALGQTDRAIKQYQELGQAGGQLELARALLTRNLRNDKADWAPVEEALAALDKAQPDSVDVVLLWAELHLARNNPEQVQAVLQGGLARQPGRIELWNALAMFLERQGRADEVGKVLDAAEKYLGDVVPMRLARARSVAVTSKEDAAKPALTRLEDGWQKFPVEQQAALLSGLGDAYLNANLLRDSTRVWQQVASLPKHAKDVRVQLILFDLGLRLDDDAQMARALAEVKKLEGGDSPSYLYGEAARRISLARQGKTGVLKEARQLLDRVVQLRPAWPAVLLAKAEVDDMEGNAEQAIANYRRAIEQGERSPRVLRQLVQLLTRQQRPDEAELVMKQLEQQSQLSPEHGRLKIALALQTDQFGAAAQMARQNVAADSKDYRDHLWLGQVLSANGRPSHEAEQALRQAVALADTVPDPWVALIQYLVKTNQTPQALKVLTESRAKLPEAQAALPLAQCSELVGDVPQARQFYEAALRNRPDEILVHRVVVGFHLRNGGAREAEGLLRAVLGGKLKAAEADLAWARRSLAMALAGSGNPKRLEEALTLVGLSLDAQGALQEVKFSDTESREDQLARARVLATQPRRSFRVRAIALLEGVAKGQTLPPDEQLVLAHLYLAQGQDEVAWGKARELMVNLVTHYPRNAAYLALVAEAFIKNNDAREALKVIARLEQVEKARQVVAGASPATELKARALEALGKGSEALELLRAYAAAPGASQERLLLVAAVCGRLGEVKEATDLCQLAATTCAVENVGATSVTLLREARAVKDLQADAWKTAAERTTSWFQDVLQKQPENTALQLQLADLEKLLDRPQGAEKLYRQVLAREPRQVVALNNLAWMLAERGTPSDEALTLINRAIEDYGPRPEFLDTRAVVQLNLGRFDAASADLKRAIDDAPTFTKYLHLAEVHRRTKDRPAAQATLRLARGLMPNLNRLSPTDLATYRRLEKELN